MAPSDRRQKPQVTEETEKARAAREEKLAAALRENLKRRKQQRQAGDGTAAPSEPGGE